MSDEITTLKTCLLQMQNANVDLVKQLDDCRRECAELKARLISQPPSEDNVKGFLDLINKPETQGEE